MRLGAGLVLISIILVLYTTAPRAQVCSTCPSFNKNQSPPIRKLASLVGCWTGKGPYGLGAKVSYSLGSDNTALLETIWIEKNPTMYTVYYLDGDVAMAHHFCSYGNQLRMRATASTKPNELFLKLFDSTNLPNRKHNHMRYVRFTFLNNDRFDVDWGLHHNGKDLPQVYAFKRIVQGCTGNPDEW